MKGDGGYKVQGIILQAKPLWNISCRLIRGRCFTPPLARFKRMHVDLPLKREFRTSEPAKWSLPSLLLSGNSPPTAGKPPHVPEHTVFVMRFWGVLLSERYF